jgi:hypothetical protein
MVKNLKTAEPRAVDFEQESFIQRHCRLQKALQSSCGKDHPWARELGSVKSICEISYRLQVYHEKAFGKSSPYPRFMVKLPATVFRDTSPSGSLFVVLSTAFDFIKEANWSDLNFVGERKKIEFLTMFRRIEKALMENGFVSSKRIFFQDDIPTEVVKEIKLIAKNHGAMIVDSPEYATHSVYYDPEVDVNVSPRADEEEFMRAREVRPNQYVFREAGKALVHWWYYPDSYDEWIPDRGQVQASEPPETVEKNSSWIVNCRYIRDVEVFNEWGNEIDYEKYADDGADTTASSGSKRKGDQNTITASVPILDKIQPDAMPPSVALSTKNTVTVTTEPDGQIKVKMERSGNGGEKRKKISSLRSPVVQPSWFVPDCTSAVEIKNVPDFFDESSEIRTPAEYLRIRDLMVKLYNDSPSTYLSATDCRKQIAGNASSIVRIHSFLDAFRVINHSVKADARPRTSTYYCENQFSDISVTANNTNLSVEFTEAMDSALREAVLEVEGDWKAVAEIVSKVTLTKSKAPSPSDCFMRFVELPLLGSKSAISASGPGLNMNTKSERLKLLATNALHQLIQRKLPHNVITQATQAALSVIQQGIENKMDVDGKDDMNNLHVATSTAMGTTLATIIDEAQNEAADVRRSLREILLEYVTLRVDAMEEKLKLLENTEIALDIEQDRIASERRDLQICRAQMSILWQ